ncbi:MAG: hypothetical protein KF723_13380 [Rhizobiaceae bacterium]|nr:hypothetical protein [Rhizobiaceae bacterium]
MRPLLDQHYASMSALYAENPLVLADYASASMRYRMGVDQLAGEAAPLVEADEPAFFIPWLWATPDGATIRKLRDGSFVITSARLLGNWYAETRCFNAGWPAYYCDDETERLMSAPDAATLIFDDIVYSRAVPTTSVDTEPQTEIDGLVTGDLGSLGADRVFAPMPKKKK